MEYRPQNLPATTILELAGFTRSTHGPGYQIVFAWRKNFPKERLHAILSDDRISLHYDATKNNRHIAKSRHELARAMYEKLKRLDETNSPKTSPNN